MKALKLKKFTIIIASSLGLWNVGITSVNAAQLTFINDTNQTATDFHVKFKLAGQVFERTLNSNNGFNPVPVGGSFSLSPVLSDNFISGEWSFAQGPNKPALPKSAEHVPEPTTIFGSALALGVGGWLKRKKSSQQNKTTLQP